MIVIVEGIDRVGKTTLANKLKNAGFIYFKDLWHTRELSNHTSEFSLGKLDTTITSLKTLSDNGMNVVVDRFYITELAYTVNGRSRDVSGLTKLIEVVGKIEDELNKMKATLVFVEPTDINHSAMLAGEYQEGHNDTIGAAFINSKIKNKLKTNFHFLDYTANQIISTSFKYHFYLASPWFNPEQAEREQFVKKILVKKGYNVFSPKDETKIGPKADEEARRKAFADNCDGIINSAAVLAITDGKDIGTIWEAGFAFGINKPVLYYAETLGNSPFNLMLAQSGKDIVLTRDQLKDTNLMKKLFTSLQGYKGLIE